MSIELKTASGGSVTLVPEDGVSNVTATVKHESGVLASEFDAGVGRTWQDVTASRSSGVTYTNNTGRDIEVSVGATLGASSGRSSVTGFVNGESVTVSRVYANTGISIMASVIFTVPTDSTYKVDNVEGNLQYWWELR